MSAVVCLQTCSCLVQLYDKCANVAGEMHHFPLIKILFGLLNFDRSYVGNASSVPSQSINASRSSEVAAAAVICPVNRGSPQRHG